MTQPSSFLMRNSSPTLPSNWRGLVFLLFGIAFSLAPLRAAEPADTEEAAPPAPAAGKKASKGSLSSEANALLVAAGNALTDKERLKLLKELDQRTDLSADFRTDLRQMIRFVEMWENGYEVSKGSPKYLNLAMTPAPKVKEFGPKLTNNEILNTLVLFYLGRARIQGFIQTGQKHAVRSEEEKEKFEDGLIALFRRPRAVLTENLMVGMYCGYPIPWPKDLEVTPDPKAPEWANLQREGLEKLGQVMRWWIKERQKPEGFFGSNWGDDVELWRTFVPLTVAFQDPELAASQAKLSEAIFEQPHMTTGFSSLTGKGMDAEHISEDSSDTVTPMLFLAPEDPVWRKRALHALDLAKDKWSGKNEQGKLQFKSTYFNAKGINFDGVKSPEAQSVDTVYHGRALQPAMVLWQQGSAPEVGEFVLPWMDTWLGAAMSDEKGKPVGIIPTAIHWPDGKAGGIAPEWWKPANFDTALYDWPSAGAIIANTMLLSYEKTGDPKYLEPLFKMAQYRRDFLAGKLGDPSVEGSAAWAANKLKPMLSILAKYRLMTGDTQFDDLLEADASGYTVMRLTGDRSRLVADLTQNAQAFRVNFEAYTSECRAGDRVMAGPSRYFGIKQMPHPMAIPKVGTLYESTTGNPSMDIYGMTNAVRWLTPPKDIAALVTDGGQKSFAAELFHFGDADRPMEAVFQLLQPGDYTVSLKEEGEGGKELFSQKIQIKDGPFRQKLTLPSQTLCLLTIAPAS